MGFSSIEQFVHYLQSASTAQQFLQKTYRKQNIEEADTYSFQNSYRFLYYIEHGHTFYQTAKQSPLTVQPILLFYGMVHLIKACLLTQRPEYPENTAVLAHGVSTRKRKKQDYSFLQDEVKVQQKGLFPYFSKYLFHVDYVNMEKSNMEQLFASIPEMTDMFYFLRQEHSLVKVGDREENILMFPEYLLDYYHLTENTFKTRLEKDLGEIDIQKREKLYDVQLHQTRPALSKGPLLLHREQMAYYFPIKRHYYHTYDEVMIHYLLLYNLSMICRYETEWWGDLLHTKANEDFPFIKEFLKITADKIPFLLGEFLYQQQ
ncbi:YaaC family protein [Radiobacillus kanasensis]|uniref:YaaC family protein n=1 Tax=Radiobacillus kanasensis TaxID=2844358 RepID=UPI001E41832E|nr:YaaC family protein [Radiobacillus kanasensis]UFT99435.1 YaaC family protein [Radiobacillus kanasensis]